MGFALTLLYIILTLVSPDQFGPEWANYHPMVYLAVITAVASLPSLLVDTHWKSSLQTRLMLGFMAAIVLSQLSSGRFRGALDSVQTILPGAVVFFFIVANVTTVRRLKIIIWTTAATCLGVAVEALAGYYSGFGGDMFVLHQNGELLRLRGAGFLNDPNDLAQILLIALAFIFIGWNRGRAIVNSLVVLVPAAVLLWAIYLTHSRGALIASAALALMAFQKKIGTAASAVLAGSLAIGLMALDFTGGRGISAADGADRLELWSTGLQFFKSAPLFGIGFGRFTEFSDLTAHNSFVLCLAELGLVGSTILVALCVSSLMNLNRIIESQERLPADRNPVDDLGLEMQGAPAASEWESFYYEPDPALATAPISAIAGLESNQETVAVESSEEWAASFYEREATRETVTAGDIEMAVEGNQEHIVLGPFAVVIRLALVSFIVTSFFLSRSYVATMYLILGLATATIALEQPTLELDDWRPLMVYTLGVEALAVIFIYCIVRLRF